MQIGNIIQLLTNVVALATAGWLLFRSRSMYKVDHATQDADASSKYAQAATQAADLLARALERMDNIEDKSQKLEDKVNKLQDVLIERDKCIDTLNRELRWRDDVIEEQTRGIKILITQLREKGEVPLWQLRDSKRG